MDTPAHTPRLHLPHASTAPWSLQALARLPSKMTLWGIGLQRLWNQLRSDLGGEFQYLEQGTGGWGERAAHRWGLSGHPLSPLNLPHLVERDMARGGTEWDALKLSPGQRPFLPGSKGVLYCQYIQNYEYMWIMGSWGPMWQEKVGQEQRNTKRCTNTRHMYRHNASKQQSTALCTGIKHTLLCFKVLVNMWLKLTSLMREPKALPPAALVSRSPLPRYPPQTYVTWQPQTAGHSTKWLGFTLKICVMKNKA